MCSNILNGRPVLRIAARRRSKSHGRGLRLRPIGCTPYLSVTYSAAAAAVAAWCYISAMPLPVPIRLPRSECGLPHHPSPVYHRHTQVCLLFHGA